jgi:hypothetical protein
MIPAAVLAGGFIAYGIFQEINEYRRKRRVERNYREYKNKQK